MLADQDLKGRRVAVLAVDGVEKIEFTVPVKALRLAGATVDVVSLRKGRIRSVNLHEPASRIRVNKVLGAANPMDYDCLFIPGGFISPDLLRQSAEARDFVRAFDEENKPIASICHGLWVLASAGVLAGRTVTSWPGVRDDLVNAGATWLNQEVVCDRNLVTSRGPQDMDTFVVAIKDLFADRKPLVDSISHMMRSDPQIQQPPQTILRTMKWMPRPSLRVAIGFALLSLLFLIPRSTREAHTVH